MTVINTNLLSLKAQQQSTRSHSQLSTTLDRLSSGLRVNSAKDDAAAQAIANRFEAQKVGIGQGARNANDGISMSQTAQGVLSSINDKLQRIRDLTVQGLNGTNQNTDSDAIQAEINQNLMEIDRLAASAEYNGIPLLDGSAGDVQLQVGANDGEVLNLDLNPPGFSVAALGLEDFNVAGDPGSVTPRDTLVGQAKDILVDHPSTSVTYPDGAEAGFYQLPDSSEKNGYYVSMGGGDFAFVDWQATHETATDHSDLTISNPREMYQPGAFAAQPISGLADNQRLVSIEPDGESRTYYIEDNIDGALFYRKAGFSVDFDQAGGVVTTVVPEGDYLDGGDYYTSSDKVLDYTLADYDSLSFPDAPGGGSSQVVKGIDDAGNTHYYVKSNVSGDVSYFAVDDANTRLSLSVDELVGPPGGTGHSVTEAIEVDGETYAVSDFDSLTFSGMGPGERDSAEIFSFADEDGADGYYVRTGEAGSYKYYDITRASSELSISSDSQAYAGVDLFQQAGSGAVIDTDIDRAPGLGSIASGAGDFPSGLGVDDAELVQRTDDGSWVIRGKMDSGEGFGFYDAGVEFKLDSSGALTGYRATTTQNDPTVLGAADQVVEKVYGTSTVTIDPRNVSVEYTDAEGRVYEEVLREGEDGNYYFELPGESSLLGGYKTATLVDFDQNGEIILRTENGNSEVVVYYPTDLEGGVNRSFFVETDGDGESDDGVPHTTLRIQEAGEDFRIQMPRNPLAAVDRAIGMVDAKRSHLGAVDNRLSSVIEGNDMMETNLASAQSRLIDADYAQETAKMVKLQIIQQAGQSILAQANVVPEVALALLGDG
ncbi:MULTISPECIES: flagellin [unclassified Halomonas]|uniref:flagellin N-terminal helical domain-containing protein n=1 Tax=unclassified Halomonas TaxID=2609666 RepID=UPI000C8F22FE|nr:MULTISPECIES: flagellin [unclassified Halomonas]MAR71783.1 hypothetical protein [Halomonas sp.]